MLRNHRQDMMAQLAALDGQMETHVIDLRERIRPNESSIEATFNDFGAGILRQTATNFNLRVQSEVGPRPDQEDSGPQGRPKAGFEEDWASEGTEVHLSSVRGAGRPAALRLAGIAGG